MEMFVSQDIMNMVCLRPASYVNGEWRPLATTWRQRKCISAEDSFSSL